MITNTLSACVNCGVARCRHCFVEPHEVARGLSRVSSRTVRSTRTSRPADAESKPADTQGSTSRPATAETKEGESETRFEMLTRSESTVKKIWESPSQRASPQPRDLTRDLLDVKDQALYQTERPSIDNTEGSDAQTVVSNFSSVTTLVDPGAVGEFSQSIMKFQSLGYLWPQLVERCDTEQRCIHVMERLLKRYAKDLALVGDEMAVSKMSDNQLCLTAARFVRKSRFQIAQ